MRPCVNLWKAKAGQSALWRIDSDERLRVARIHEVDGQLLTFRWFHWACSGDGSFLVTFNAYGVQVAGGFTIDQRIHPFTLWTTIDFLAGWTIAQGLRYRSLIFKRLGAFFYRWA